ncbi:MAG TPA: hypothetical protein VIG32_11120 [Candidatus Baltobacteraceae bacterium]|jgi:hypothetical protein
MVKRSIAITLVFAGLLAGWPTPAAGSGPSYGELMSALKNGPSEAEKFRAMMGNLTAGEFHLTNVTGLLAGNADQTAFTTALKKDAGDIADLRETLAHTTLTGSDGIVEMLATLLKGQDLTVGRIVAVDVQGAQITLFYQ